MEIEIINDGICECGEAAVRLINGVRYCASCADPVLIKQIRKCADAVVNAKVKFTVMPISVTKKAGSEIL